MRIFSVLTAGLALLSAFHPIFAQSASPEPGTVYSTRIPTREFFPVAPAAVWKYVDKASNEEFTITVGQPERIHGVKCHKLVRSRANRPNDYDLVSVDRHGVQLHFRCVKSNPMDLAPAVTLAERRLVLEKHYLSVPTLVNPATGNKMEWQVVAQKMESVTVPAGTFPECVKLRLFVKDAGLGTSLANVEMWYARGTVLVKRYGQFFGVPMVEELRSVSGLPKD